MLGFFKHFTYDIIRLGGRGDMSAAKGYKNRLIAIDGGRRWARKTAPFFNPEDVVYVIRRPDNKVLWIHEPARVTRAHY
jgi:hypothetical protein